jgi:hypothetical protein
MTDLTDLKALFHNEFDKFNIAGRKLLQSPAAPTLRRGAPASLH